MPFTPRISPRRKQSMIRAPKLRADFLLSGCHCWHWLLAYTCVRMQAYFPPLEYLMPTMRRAINRDGLSA